MSELIIWGPYRRIGKWWVLMSPAEMEAMQRAGAVR
jgi:hypothetical protein